MKKPIKKMPCENYLLKNSNLLKGQGIPLWQLQEGIFEPGRNKERGHGPVLSGQSPTLLPNKVPQ
jgi:hypothetical protein